MAASRVTKLQSASMLGTYILEEEGENGEKDEETTTAESNPLLLVAEKEKKNNNNYLTSTLTFSAAKSHGWVDETVYYLQGEASPAAEPKNIPQR